MDYWMAEQQEVVEAALRAASGASSMRETDPARMEAYTQILRRATGLVGLKKRRNWNRLAGCETNHALRA